MKILKFRPIGETNSSSTHALFIGEYKLFDIEELKDMKLVIDLNKDAITTEFGWGYDNFFIRDKNDINNIKTILYYLNLISVYNRFNKEFVESIKSMFDISLPVVNKEDIYTSGGFIDHQSVPYFNAWNDKKELGRFLALLSAHIIVRNSGLYIDNDNTPYYNLDQKNTINLLQFLNSILRLKQEEDYLFHITLFDGSYLLLDLSPDSKVEEVLR